MSQTLIKIAVQKKGRLADKSIQLLQKIGLEFEISEQKLSVKCTNYPAEILFIRDDDIPEFVRDGIADLGISGENIVWEKTVEVKNLLKLGFGNCALILAVPKKSKIKAVKDLAGSRIVTSYPQSAAKFLSQNKIKAEIIKIAGSVELAPEIGLGNAIIDLVATGATLERHGLKPIMEIYKSEAVLIANPKSCLNKKEHIEELLIRLKAVLASQGKKYVMLNVHKKNLLAIEKILPSLDAPTILPLAKEDELSVHTVMSESQFWQILSKLKQAGAKDILVLDIEKMVR